MIELNAFLLELRLKVANISTKKAAKATQMDPATFYRKKTGDSDFYRREIQILRKS